MSYNLVFLGTAPFGFPVMRALDRDDRVELKGVITQPDRERGRGRETQSPPVADYALELNLPLFQPEDINDGGIEILDAIGPIDFGIVIAYGQILSSELLNHPENGFFNFHASLLPRWRGASPIRHALMHGDSETGVTVFRVEEELDTGPICVRLETPVRENENYGQLYERLGQVNVGALNVLLSDLESDNLCFRAQEGTPTYAPQIGSDAGRINWDNTAEEIRNTILAFAPDPGAFTFRDENRIKIYEVEVNADDSSEGNPGEIVRLTSDRIVVATGRGTLEIVELQPAGSRRMSVESYLAGNPEIRSGERFDHEETIEQ